MPTKTPKVRTLLDVIKEDQTARATGHVLEPEPLAYAPPSDRLCCALRAELLAWRGRRWWPGSGSYPALPGVGLGPTGADSAAWFATAGYAQLRAALDEAEALALPESAWIADPFSVASLQA